MKKSSRKPTEGHASDHFPKIGGIRLLEFYQLSFSSFFPMPGFYPRHWEKSAGPLFEECLHRI